ncbi:MAG TPA: ATP-dependent DNA helicase [Propionicimonas sp.]|nr:ATP-dependent DNA helicase [Propionicimonas sp.]
MLTDPQELAGLLGIPYSAQQLDAITAPLTPGVIIAGAGSGKTTVMAARVVWLVGTGQVSAGQVLGLTFTRKAAAKLDQDVREALLTAALVDADAAEPVVLTYDAFAGQLVSDYGLLLGEEPTSRLITDATRYRLAARVVADAVGPFAMLSTLQPATVVERVLRLAADMKSHLVGTDDIIRHADRFATAVGQAPRRNTGEVYRAVQQADEVRAERLELLELVTSYERLKRELGYQEFSDQLATAARLIDEVPQVARRLREDFRVVLLDEYQDTSSAQARLLRGLFSGADPRGGRGHAVTAVGDPCQAIYGWRGAAARNILDFATDFPLADGSPAPSFPLTVNRRSGPQILAAANRLADSVRSDPLLTGQQLDLELVAPPQAPQARIEARAYLTWPEETAALTDRIADLRSTAAVPSWKEMAVLCRNNSQVSAVYTALVERDIPAQIVGLGGLLDVPVIAEVVATLSVLADPTENPSLIRLLTSPRWAIGLPDLALLGKRAADLAGDRAVETPSLAEALADPGRAAYSTAARQRFGLLSAELAGLRRYLHTDLPQLVSRVVSTLGLAVEAETLAVGASAPLRAFQRAVAEYAQVDVQASLSGLLAYLEAERSYGVGLEQAVVSSADSVKILTVHKAKGLEWEVVFLPGLAESVFPNARVSDDWVRQSAVLPFPLRGDSLALPQLGEVSNAALTSLHEDLREHQVLSEDRLAYVAATRARRLLVASTHAWAGELTKPRVPSRYFAVLAEHADVVERTDDIGEVNPLAEVNCGASWPVLGGTEELALRREAAAEVRAARRVHGSTAAYPAPADLDSDGEALRREWRHNAQVLVALEVAQRRERAAVRPAYVSVTGLGQLQRDAAAFRRTLRRPMPRLVSESQRWGIDFHRWLENRFAQQGALIADDTELVGVTYDRLREGFESSPYANAVPVAVEAPFTLVLSGQLVRGRIDAVFVGDDGRPQVVDWKTGSAAAADPLQLACYRLAWAELTGVAVSDVDAVFYDLQRSEVLRPQNLADRAGLEAVVRAGMGNLHA